MEAFLVEENYKSGCLAAIDGNFFKPILLILFPKTIYCTIS